MPGPWPCGPPPRPGPPRRRRRYPRIRHAGRTPQTPATSARQPRRACPRCRTQSTPPGDGGVPGPDPSRRRASARRRARTRHRPRRAGHPQRHRRRPSRTAAPARRGPPFRRHSQACPRSPTSQAGTRRPAGTSARGRRSSAWPQARTTPWPSRAGQLRAVPGSDPGRTRSWRRSSSEISPPVLTGAASTGLHHRPAASRQHRMPPRSRGGRQKRLVLSGITECIRNPSPPGEPHPAISRAANDTHYR